MSRSPEARYRILRAVLRFGSGASNTKLVNTTGLSLDSIKGVLHRMQGKLVTITYDPDRCIAVTPAGHDFLAHVEEKITGPSLRRPSARHKGEAKQRPCLMCSASFRSEWPGHRICTSCKSHEAWRGGAGNSYSLGNSVARTKRGPSC